MRFVFSLLILFSLFIPRLSNAQDPEISNIVEKYQHIELSFPSQATGVTYPVCLCQVIMIAAIKTTLSYTLQTVSGVKDMSKNSKSSTKMSFT